MKASLIAVLIGLSFAADGVFAKALEYQDARDCSEDQLSVENAWQGYFQVAPSEEVKSDRSIGPQCVLWAMDKFHAWVGGKKNYALCSSESAEPIRSSKPLCRTEKLVTQLASLYNQFSLCAGVDPKLFFTAISSESGFFPNALAPGMDAGLGQLTPEAIIDVNNNWDTLVADIKNSADPACAQMKNWLEELRVPSENAVQSCGFISAPQNPARNLMYALLMFKQNRRYYQDLFQSGPFAVNQEALGVPLLIEEERRRLVDHMSLLTYNMGFVRLSTLLLAYVGEIVAPFEQASERGERLRIEIQELQSKIQTLKREREFTEARAHSLKVLELKKAYRALFEKLRETPISAERLDPFNVSKEGFGGFLRKAKEAHYLNLLLGRLESSEEEMLDACAAR